MNSIKYVYRDVLPAANGLPPLPVGAKSSAKKGQLSAATLEIQVRTLFTLFHESIFATPNVTSNATQDQILSTIDKIATKLEKCNKTARNVIAAEVIRLCGTVSAEHSINIILVDRDLFEYRIGEILTDTTPRVRNIARRILAHHIQVAGAYALQLATKDAQPPGLEKIAKCVAGVSVPLGLRIAAACQKAGWKTLAYEIEDVMAGTMSCQGMLEHAETCMRNRTGAGDIIQTYYALNRAGSGLVNALTSSLLDSTSYEAMARLITEMSSEDGFKAFQLLCRAHRLDAALSRLSAIPARVVTWFSQLGPEYNAMRHAIASRFLTKAMRCLDDLEPKLQAAVYPAAPHRQKVSNALTHLQTAQRDPIDSFAEFNRRVETALDILVKPATAMLSEVESNHLLRAVEGVIAAVRLIPDLVVACDSEDSRPFKDHSITLGELVQLTSRCENYRAYLESLQALSNDVDDKNIIRNFSRLFLLDGDPEETGKGKGMSGLRALDLFQHVVNSCVSVGSRPRYDHIHDNLTSAVRARAWTAVSESVFVGPAKRQLMRFGLAINEREFTALKPGEQLVRLAGWSHKASGHAICELVRCREASTFDNLIPTRTGRYSVSVLNSGTGLKSNHVQIRPWFSELPKTRIDFTVEDLTGTQALEYLEIIFAARAFISTIKHSQELVESPTQRRIRAQNTETGLRLHYDRLKDIVAGGVAYRQDSRLVSRSQQFKSCTVESLKRLMVLLLGEEDRKPFHIESKMLVYATWHAHLTVSSARQEVAKTLTKYVLAGIAESSPERAAKILRELADANNGWIPGAIVKKITSRLAVVGGANHIASFFRWLGERDPGLALDALGVFAKTPRRSAAQAAALHLALTLAPAPNADAPTRRQLFIRLKGNPRLFHVGDAWEQVVLLHPAQKKLWHAFFQAHKIPWQEL